MTTPTKPTKEATTPLPVLTEDKVKAVREWADPALIDRRASDNGFGRQPVDSWGLVIALADHWLRTQAVWVAWKPGDAMPADGEYWVTRGDPDYPWACVADVTNGKWPLGMTVYAYWPIALPAPFAPPQEPAINTDKAYAE